MDNGWDPGTIMEDRLMISRQVQTQLGHSTAVINSTKTWNCHGSHMHVV